MYTAAFCVQMDRRYVFSLIFTPFLNSFTRRRPSQHNHSLMLRAQLAIGPTAGGTALTVAGALLHGGSDYRCRFTRNDGSFREEPAALVGDVVTCNSSAAPLAVAALEALSISLNGQQYTSDDTTPRRPR